MSGFYFQLLNFNIAVVRCRNDSKIELVFSLKIEHNQYNFDHFLRFPIEENLFLNYLKLALLLRFVKRKRKVETVKRLKVEKAKSEKGKCVKVGQRIAAASLLLTF